jgi:hypothetical protein
MSEGSVASVFSVSSGREMGRATNQGEVGLVIDNVYHAIRFD